MKKFVTILFLVIAGVLQLKAQEQKPTNKPDEQIIVNKEYDEKGNLIQYDSTYVHQWSSDSTYSFSFGDGFPNLLDHSAVDSLLQQFGISSGFGISPFADNDFFSQFENWFPDSLFMDHFDQQSQFQNFLNTPDFDQIQKQLQRQQEYFNQYVPQFQNEEQRKEWEEMMEKQQKEKEDFLRKPEEDN